MVLQDSFTVVITESFDENKFIIIFENIPLLNAACFIYIEEDSDENMGTYKRRGKDCYLNIGMEDQMVNYAFFFFSWRWDTEKCLKYIMLMIVHE